MHSGGIIKYLADSSSLERSLDPCLAMMSGNKLFTIKAVIPGYSDVLSAVGVVAGVELSIIGSGNQTGLCYRKSFGVKLGRQ